MYVKFCEHCGKKFPTKSSRRKYCSKKCSMEASQKTKKPKGQICWVCKNACGGCSWSKEFKPVTGWLAKTTIIKDSEGDIFSYKIKKCPEFIRG